MENLKKYQLIIYLCEFVRCYKYSNNESHQLIKEVALYNKSNVINVTNDDIINFVLKEKEEVKNFKEYLKIV